jgi:pseudaminic acid cytidylyltransferase
MKLAVIPARGGSKRIPRKNIRLFNGKPAIAYPVLAALDSGCFDRVIVSTDDEEIAAIATEVGAEVPFLRPAAIADDHATTLAVVQHAIHALEATQSQSVQWTCCIYATALFVQPDDIRRGWELLREQQADYAFSVTSYAFPIQRAIRLTASGRVAMMHPEFLNTRSQDLEPAWHDAGQFYWGRAGAFTAGLPVLSEAAVPVVLPRYRVQDIDTEEDWQQAELMYQLMTAAR